MSDLPVELINEIFHWLPVRSLVRFRRVCKLFNAIIQSKSFISSHFKRSSENKIRRKLIDLGVHMIDDKRLKIYALEFNDDFQQELVLDRFHPIELHPLFFSYCNGLVLLFIDKLSLWNPSTKQYRILPDFPVNYTRNLKFALGYDSNTDNYKVVAVIPEKEWNRSEVWIFELRSSSWRQIQDFPCVDYNIGGGGNGDCFVDGTINFLCYHGDEYSPSHTIVAFDVAKETFSVVNEPIYKTRVFATRLHVYEGCLAITLYSMTTEERVDMYVRKMDGVAFTWARLYSITEPHVLHEAFQRFASGRVAFSKDGSKVFLSPNGKLCSYDLEGKSLQEIVTINTHQLDMFAYTESLMSVGS